MTSSNTCECATFKNYRERYVISCQICCVARSRIILSLLFFFKISNSINYSSIVIYYVGPKPRPLCVVCHCLCRTTMEISACALLCYPNIFNVILYVHVMCIQNTFLFTSDGFVEFVTTSALRATCTDWCECGYPRV